jgi:subtilisin family serine protease
MIRSRLLGALSLCAVALGCSSKESTPVELSQPATLIIASGDAQSANGAAALTAPLVLRIIDVKNRGVSGVSVTWSASDTGARLSAATSTTDSQGQAQVQWTLGASPGRQTVTATTPRLPGASAVFQAINAAAAKVAITSGDNQVGDAGVALPTALVIRVTDALDRPAVGATIAWTASGGGSIAPPTSTTDAQGQATVVWTLSPSPGAQSAEAATTGTPVAKAVFRASNGATISGGVTISNGPLGSLTPSVSLRASTSLSNGAGASLGRPSRSASRATMAEQLRAAGNSTRRAIVEFKAKAMGMSSRIASSNGAAIQAVMTAMSGTIAPFASVGLVAQPEYSPMILAARVTVPQTADINVAIAALRANADVESVTVDEIVPMLEDYAGTELLPISKGIAATAQAIGGAVPGTLPNDPLLTTQYWHYNMIDAPRAWATATGSANVLVAVVDNGIRPSHPAIAANLTVDGRNFVAGGNRLSVAAPVCGGGGTTLLTEVGYSADPTQPDDFDGFTGTCWQRSTVGNHGMHVAGTIGAAGNDAIGGTGINWTVRIRPVRALDITGSGSFFDIAQGVLYAAGLPASNGTGGTVTALTRAALINMSLGGSSNTSVLANAVTAATNAGTLIIASAGNSESNSPSYPAAYPEVVSVVALGPDMQLAAYSSVGSTVSLAAPGGSFRFTNTSGVVSSTWNFVTGVANYAYYQGTSMAAPHVTGVAALVLGANPTLTAAQLRARLQNTAVDLGPPGRDDRFGYGLVNAYNALNNVTAPRRDTYVRIVEAVTGTVVKTVAVRSDGSYTVSRLAAGSYYVFAGQDEGTDRVIGMPGRRWGWFGGSAGPTLVQLGPTQNVNASIAIGLPVETEPNNTVTQATRIPVNGYVTGQVTNPDVTDMYVVTIPAAGTYFFETTGVIGSCGFGLELDTVLSLLDSNGAVITTNDDTVFPSSQFCSSITRTLTPGTYYLSVTGSLSSQGQYRLWVRDTP